MESKSMERYLERKELDARISELERKLEIARVALGFCSQHNIGFEVVPYEVSKCASKALEEIK